MLTACLAVQHPHLTFLMLHPGWVQTDMGGAGGRTADIGVEANSDVHIQVFSGATLEMSGKFFDWRGQEIPF